MNLDYVIQNHSKKLETDQRYPCGKRDVGGCAKQQHEQSRVDQWWLSRGGCLYQNLRNRHQKGRCTEYGVSGCGKDWMKTSWF